MKEKTCNTLLFLVGLFFLPLTLIMMYFNFQEKFENLKLKAKKYGFFQCMFFEIRVTGVFYFTILINLFYFVGESLGITDFVNKKIENIKKFGGAKCFS